MLLPSALQCDSSQTATARLQTALFASPPASPPSASTQTALGNIVNTCRSLQALIATPTASASPPPAHQLPTPPMSYAEPPPLKLRLRSRMRPEGSNEYALPRKRIIKRQPPRGLNKRRRALDDDIGRDDVENDEFESEVESLAEIEDANVPAAPQTPKRARLAPEVIPLGLERSDYHSLHLEQSESNEGLGISQTQGDDEWTTEDDRILVELVLEKLKLTKSDWQDCARSLGKDRHSIGRRWRSLMINGDVGLKTRNSRRARLHSTWR
ncbi:hypothetical protein jhhlp_007321 [Lomentospora prolificans]|uniref:Myb-like domain-containing protein n=1 Tax=Lomentospora prolificans TaxID=41688 RepID=A0A2N3N2D1_9PEZI|nr:hypothetical protein jhhlp_007321 [Lomentospora prolificans]